MTRILFCLALALTGCTRADQASIRKTLGANDVWSCDDVAGKHCRWVDAKKQWPWAYDKEHWLPNCNGKPMPPDTLAAYRRGDPWTCDPNVTISTTPQPPLPNLSSVSLSPSAFAGLGLMGAGTSTNLATGTTTSNPPWVSAFSISRDCSPLDGVKFRGGTAWICGLGGRKP